jgi:hypothetical protein
MTVKEVVNKVVKTTPVRIESHWSSNIVYDFDSEVANREVESLIVRDGQLVIGI